MIGLARYLHWSSLTRRTAPSPGAWALNGQVSDTVATIPVTVFQLALPPPRSLDPRVRRSKRRPRPTTKAGFQLCSVVDRRVNKLAFSMSAERRRPGFGRALQLPVT